MAGPGLPTKPVPSVESAELLIHDGYSDSAAPNGPGQPNGETSPASPQVLNQMNLQLQHHQTLHYSNVTVGLDGVLLQETAEALHRLKMEENRALSRHEEIIRGMAETYQNSLLHVESRLRMFESACEERVRATTTQEQDNNEKARQQLVIECEKKAQSVVDGMIANARAAYVEKDREMIGRRAGLKEANDRLTSKNQEHLRIVEQLHMKIMLLESRQGPGPPGRGAQHFDISKDDELEEKESNLDKIEREAKAKLGELRTVRTGFKTQIKSPQLFREARGNGGHGAGPQSSPQSVTISSGDQLMEALRKASSGPKPAEETSLIGSKIQEADAIFIPAFPALETYRDWRIKVRDTIVAASTNPDAAFAWVSELWSGKRSAGVRSSGAFPSQRVFQLAWLHLQHPGLVFSEASGLESKGIHDQLGHSDGWSAADTRRVDPGIPVLHSRQVPHAEPSQTTSLSISGLNRERQSTAMST